MNRAEQAALSQTTNLALVSIRQSEIQYFTDFFGNFGTQCFFVTAILAGSVSQTPSFDCASGCSYFWQYVYNISVAVSMGFTVVALLNSVFISVYAQGLAIRGKEGSMITAIHGMIGEQEKIVYLFIFSVISFGISFIGMTFVVMDEPMAYICMVMMLLCYFYTYRSTLRIYNRFKWDFNKSGWNFDDKLNEEKELNDLSHNIVDELSYKQYNSDISSSSSSLQKQNVLTTAEKNGRTNNTPTAYLTNPLHENRTEQPQQSERGGEERKEKDAKSSNNAETTKGRKFVHFSGFPSLLSKKNKQKNLIQDDNESNNDPTVFATPYYEMKDLDNLMYKIHYKGYLATPSTSSTTSSALSFLSSSSSSSKWIRYYFILKGTYLYYYETQRAFELNPSKPVNTRPIDLEGYDLNQNAAPPAYEFSIIPNSTLDIRKTWKFRCDTVHEYDKWIEQLAKMINSANNL
jgi:hypothetical protein